ncbi:hypothetical protein CRE_11119 [Caenorhabditis remanei]|uniref:BESS domain-containing protein n=2 Tax=Caenorhabditis remanei TaxID=31234 RepID=E3M5N5_CAERE|nr:hypothetical protein CRE_11119 [Caenorhabditis remanei]
MEAAMSFIENELIRTQETNSSKSSTDVDSSSASTASSSSSKNTGGTQERADGNVVTPPPLPIPMAVTPSPSATSSASHNGVGPAVKRSRVSLTDGMTPISSRNAAVAAATSLGLSFLPGLSQWGTTREEEEDEIFARMISIKLSKLDARTKEVAKLQVLKAIFDAQFTTPPTT